MKLEINQGDRFGILSIIKELEIHTQPSGQKERKFLCKCDCGNKKEIFLHSLRRGNTKSCGCIRKKITSELTKSHGMTGDRMYRIFFNIKSRCNNKNIFYYKNYGGRGITCEWESFEEFYEDMLSTYKEGLEIDRINNDGNYSKDNCRWTTRTENLRNTRKNVYYKGKTIGEWSEITGIKYTTIYQRIKRGLTIEEALEFKKRE